MLRRFVLLLFVLLALPVISDTAWAWPWDCGGGACVTCRWRTGGRQGFTCVIITANGGCDCHSFDGDCAYDGYCAHIG
jgi:hypothetical protein